MSRVRFGVYPISWDVFFLVLGFDFYIRIYIKTNDNSIFAILTVTRNIVN